MKREPPKSIVVVGATSDIALSLMRKYATSGAFFSLVGRNKERLETVRDDLLSHHASGANILPESFENREDPSHWQNMWERIIEINQKTDLLILAQGVAFHKDPDSSVEAYSQLADSVHVNFLSVAGIAEAAARYFAARGSGQIIVISSVAGDLGRWSNYIYGSTKAALSTWLQGIRARYHSKNVQILTCKPGLTKTKMTAHMKKSLLFSEPETVAKAIFKGWERGADTIYAPGFWFVIMSIIRLIPEFIFKRLRL